jgi:hypothetical protein
MTAQHEAVSIHDADFEVLPIEILKVDLDYQRERRERIIKEILDEGFDLDAAGLIVISERPPLQGSSDPRYYIVDGQHRAEAARRSGETEVLVKIVRYKGGDAKLRMEEAKLRGKLGIRKADTPVERFKHQLAAGNNESRAIDALVESYGTHISLKPSSRHGLGCVSTLEKLYRKGTLENALAIIRQGWDTFEGRAGESAALEGVHWLLFKHSEKIDLNRLKRVMGNFPPEAVHARATVMQTISGGSLWKNYYRALLEAYNHRQAESKKLPMVEF